MPVIPVLKGLRQEDCQKFETRLGYLVRLCLNKQSSWGWRNAHTCKCEARVWIPSIYIKRMCVGQWWHTPLSLAFGRLRQGDLSISDQSGVQNKF